MNEKDGLFVDAESIKGLAQLVLSIKLLSVVEILQIKACGGIDADILKLDADLQAERI